MDKNKKIVNNKTINKKDSNCNKINNTENKIKKNKIYNRPIYIDEEGCIKEIVRPAFAAIDYNISII